MNARAASSPAASALPAVESEPAEPEQAGAEQRERDVVRLKRRLLVVAPRADDERRDEGRNARVDVHDGAAGEVERAHVGKPAAAPDPVRDRCVDDEDPKRNEDQVRREAHAFDDRARDQRRRDDAERALVRHEQVVRYRALRLEPDAAEEHARQIADPVVPGGEGERIADDRPEHPDESERDEAHHHRVEGVFRSNQPAVEERQRWRHQQHQGCRDQHPRSIGLVHELISFWRSADLQVRRQRT